MPEMKILQPLDYIILLSYFAILIFIGVYFRRYIREAKDYFAAGAAVPWWLSGVSLWMASFSATFFVIYSQIAFKYGLVAMVIAWASVPVMVIARLFFAHRWRRARVMTPLGFMEQRYSKFVHQVFVWTGLPLRLIDNALRILATGIFLAPAIGQKWFTLNVSMVIVGLIMIVYSILGGQWAVLVTDFFQFVILCLAVLTFFVLCFVAVGGFGGFLAGVRAAPDMPPGFLHPIAPPYDFFYWIMFACITFLSYNASWGLVQKYNCVATEKDAGKVAVTMGVLSFLGPLLFFFPAMVARFYLPGIMGAGVLNRSDEVYVLMALKILPVGIMGVLVAGMFSATLSTLGNEYNVLSGVLTKDFYQRMVRPDADEKKLMAWGRLNCAMIGIITLGIAFGLKYLKEVFNLIDIMVKVFGAFGPAMMIPLLAGLLFKKVNSRGAVAGVVAGMFSGVLLVVLNGVLLGIYKDRVAVDPTLSYWLKQGWISASTGVNILATLLGMVIGSALFQTPEEEKRRAREFLARMSVPSEPKLEPGKTRRSPFGIVGIGLMIYGAIIAAAGMLLWWKGQAREAFLLNLAVGSLMLLTGFLLKVLTGNKSVRIRASARRSRE
jgi:SSS family solute:Na+ symporter